jgi:putative hydrolase of HD superfamily
LTTPDEAIVQLLVYAGALKKLPRQGWLYLDVPDPESVADHTFRVALMTLLLAHDDPTVDSGRALVLALCHDLPESIAGDATPFDETLEDATVDRSLLFRSRPEYSEAADRAKRQAE